MQINLQNIQRPTLFQEFFDKLITYSNDVIEYINTSASGVTSKYSFKTNSLTNSIKLILNKIAKKTISLIKGLKIAVT